MHKPHHLSMAIAIAVAVALPHALGAQLPLTFGQWESFFWFDGVNPVDGDGFSFASAVQIRVRVADGYFAGDAFDIHLNGSPSVFAQTPSVAFGGTGLSDNGDAAWVDPDLSKAEFVLDPGTYTLTLVVRDDGGFGYGEGFIRVDEVTTSPTVSGTPEPSSLLLAITGLAGCGGLARRRKRRA